MEQELINVSLFHNSSNALNWVPWLTQPLTVPQTLFFQNIIKLKWLCWVESTKSSITFNAVCWHLPDSEPAQHVVNSESVEEAAHVLEALLPPLVIIIRHQFPVVRWETPILASG